MSKNTQKVAANVNKSDLDNFIQAGLASQESKAKAETKGSAAYSFALRASHDKDTLSQFQRFTARWEETDTKLKDANREAFAHFIGADSLIEKVNDKERKTADYRNLIGAQIKRVMFAVDMHTLGFTEFVIINEKGVAYIKGGSPLASLVWLKLDWANKKAVSEKRSELQDISLVQRTSLASPGDVSWSKLADIIAEKMNRKQGGNDATRPVSVSVKQPLAALKAVSNIASNVDASHFNNVESRIQALQTGEDILALAIEGDEYKEVRAEVDKAIEKARAILNDKLVAKAKLAAERAA